MTEPSEEKKNSTVILEFNIDIERLKLHFQACKNELDRIYLRKKRLANLQYSTVWMVPEMLLASFLSS